MINKKEIIEVLQTCFDPEIPIDLWNLGLIYDITIKNKNIRILMTLTTPGCSMAQYMAEDIKMKLSGIDGINSSEVNVTFNPPWKPEMMNDDARKKLGFSVDESSDTDEKEERNWE